MTITYGIINNQWDKSLSAKQLSHLEKHIRPS